MIDIQQESKYELEHGAVHSGIQNRTFIIGMVQEKEFQKDMKVYIECVEKSFYNSLRANVHSQNSVSAAGKSNIQLYKSLVK